MSDSPAPPPPPPPPVLPPPPSSQPQPLPQQSPSDRRLDRITSIGIWGGLEAGSYAFAGSTLVSVLAQRLSPAYRAVTLPGKVFLVCVVTSGCAVIGAEHAVYHFNRPFLTDRKLLAKEQTEGPFWRTHRFEIAGGVLAAAVTGGLLYFSGNRQRTGPEKFMSIRLFAHAAGLATLLGLVSVASIASLRERKPPGRD